MMSGPLNLRDDKPPLPEDEIISATGRFPAEIRDLYGQLIDGMQGARGLIRSGGDQGAELQVVPPTGPSVALYSGLVTVSAVYDAWKSCSIFPISRALSASWR